MMGRPSSNAAVVKLKTEEKEFRRGIRSIGHAHFYNSIFAPPCTWLFAPWTFFLLQSTRCGRNQPQVQLESPRSTYPPVKEMWCTRALNHADTASSTKG